MLLRLIILDQRFPALAIAARLIVRDLHDREPAGGAFRFAEDAVHFFEGAVGGFRVEEVGYWDDEGVAVGFRKLGAVGGWRGELDRGRRGRWGGREEKGRLAYMTAKMM